MRIVSPHLDVRVVRRLLTVLVALALVVAAAPAEAGKRNNKKPDDAVPQVGWVDYAKGSCYHPPDFDDMATGPKRMAWMETRNAIMSQWRGERGDGISFDDKVVDQFETVLLGVPDRIEVVAERNLEQCLAAMEAGGNPSNWSKWMTSMQSELTAGECPHPPLDRALQYYLEIRSDWGLPASVCKGDRVLIDATERDQYRIEPDGKWMNVAGDPDGTDVRGYPCARADCLRGQLIMRFRTPTGIDEISPVGLEKTFLAPDHGTITLMINDTELFDNEYRSKGGVVDHTGIMYKPAED